ncbi:hypothetical protein WH47_08318 [Habropoda laboriosa]|uniref:Uncharacterized protein n=1 Tax=Habropoda laboriosa TaxID=597456 RepID=A0A0L7RGF6_9HYME|nr:hypothetical protein WH47_08318 [Habropoda laboriosa]
MTQRNRAPKDEPNLPSTTCSGWATTIGRSSSPIRSDEFIPPIPQRRLKKQGEAFDLGNSTIGPKSEEAGKQRERDSRTHGAPLAAVKTRYSGTDGGSVNSRLDSGLSRAIVVIDSYRYNETETDPLARAPETNTSLFLFLLYVHTSVMVHNGAPRCCLRLQMAGDESATGCNATFYRPITSTVLISTRRCRASRKPTPRTDLTPDDVGLLHRIGSGTRIFLKLNCGGMNPFLSWAQNNDTPFFKGRFLGKGLRRINSSLIHE